MTSTSESMKRNWQDPKYREKVKKSSDKYWKGEMKRRLLEQVKKAQEET